jgi:hypothetical protein
VDSSASTRKSDRRSALENNASASRVDICRTDQGGAPLVEPLSPMALPRRVSGGVFDFTAVSPTGLGAFKLRSIGDNRSTLPNAPASRAPLVEPLSPMALPRRASGGVFGSTAVSPTGYGAFKLRSIGDNRSTLPNALASRATMVEPLSPMALPRRVSGGVFGFTAVSPTGHGAFKLPIDWGQSIYTAQRDSVTGYHGRAIVPNGSTTTRQRRRLRFYGCFSHRSRCLQAPIDWGQSIYTTQRASGTGYHGRAIVPNGSTATRQRRRLRFYGCFSHRLRCLQASDRLGTIDLHCPTR